MGTSHLGCRPNYHTQSLDFWFQRGSWLAQAISGASNWRLAQNLAQAVTSVARTEHQASAFHLSNMRCLKSHNLKLFKALCVVLSFVLSCLWVERSFVTAYRAPQLQISRCAMMAKKHKSKPRNSKKRPNFVASPGSKSSAQVVKWSMAKSPSPNAAPDLAETKAPKVSATRMAARRSKATSKTQTGKGFMIMEARSEAKTAKKKKEKLVAQKKPMFEAPHAQEEAVEVVDPAETEEARKFRERYLSAEAEIEPEWKKQMKAAKTKEDRFRVGLQVGDFKTSYGILAEELSGSFAEGDKEKLDKFLTKDVIIADTLEDGRRFATELSASKLVTLNGETISRDGNLAVSSDAAKRGATRFDFSELDATKGRLEAWEELIRGVGCSSSCQTN
eukprot:Skav209732  [mRNA]  locus=scaffold528:578593:581437:- [translate_table: standard]